MTAHYGSSSQGLKRPIGDVCGEASYTRRLARGFTPSHARASCKLLPWGFSLGGVLVLPDLPDTSYEPYTTHTPLDRAGNTVRARYTAQARRMVPD